MTKTLLLVISLIASSHSYAQNCIGIDYEQPTPAIAGVTQPTFSQIQFPEALSYATTTTLEAVAKVDEKGNPFFIWCSLDGTFESIPSSSNYSQVKFTPAPSAVDKKIVIGVQVGDALGYVKTELIEILVNKGNTIEIDPNSGETFISATSSEIIFSPPGTVYINDKLVNAEWTTNGIHFNLYEAVGSNKADFWQPAHLEIYDTNGQEIYNGCFPFKDVCPGYWYTRPIMKLWKEEVVNGYVDGTAGIYGTNDLAQRADLVAALVRAIELGNTPNPISTAPFNDVSTDDWYAPHLAYAKQIDLIQGCKPEDNLFCPTDPMSRPAAAKVIAQALLKQELQAFNNGQVPFWQFNDVQNPSDWFYFPIYALQHVQAAHGYPGGDFGVTKDLTRAEMAKIICIAKFGAVECIDPGELNKPFVIAVSPDQTRLNQNTTFSVQGFNLPETLDFSMNGCANIQPVSGGTSVVQKFTCTPTMQGILEGQVKDQIDGISLYDFKIEVVDENCLPQVDNVVPTVVNLSEQTTFTVNGSCLSENIAFYIYECEGVISEGGNSTQQDFSCTPSYKSGIHNGEIKNEQDGILLHNFNIDFVEGTPQVSRVEPLTAQLNKETIFTVYGKSLPKSLAFHLARCEEKLKTLDWSEKQTFKCIPRDQTGEQTGLIKDQLGDNGTILYEFTVNVQ